MSVCVVALLAGALFVAAGAGPGAAAAAGAKGRASAYSALPGLPYLNVGFTDDRVFEQGDTATRNRWLSVAQSLGSSVVRIGVDWVNVAPAYPAAGFNAGNPSDPQYNWSELDNAVITAAAHHQRVVFTIVHAPLWAQGRNPPPGTFAGTWMISPSAFAAFGRAIASRYSGRFPDPAHPGQRLPHVVYYQAWNEANLPYYLSPQWACSVRASRCPARDIVAFGPIWYRKMLNAFYAAVKGVDRHDVVMAAGTAPYGDPPARGEQRMAPVTWLRELFCLTPSLKPKSCGGPPPHLDALDHHPYAASPTIHAFNANDISVPDLWKIWRVLRAAQRAHHVLPAGNKPLWVSELDWSSYPTSARTLALQQRYLTLAFYEMWIQHVSNVLWFYIVDHPSEGNIFIDGGIYLSSGAAKPSAAAYRFPFLALNRGHGIITVWGRAPSRGTVTIEKRSGRRWRRVLTLRTTGGGIFYSRSHLGSKLLLRARTGNAVSPTWATG